MVDLADIVNNDRVNKKNKLKGITEMIINLDELNNTNNRKMGGLVTHYSLIMWILIKILRVSNPTLHNKRNLKMESLLP